MPKLCASWELDADIVRFFEYCHRTYRDGAAIIRQVLIDLANRWQQLVLADSCPYPSPNAEELFAHNEEYKALENAQELKQFVTSRLNTASDGWVPADAWKETIEDHKRLYEQFLEGMTRKS